jgi:hypothetical protein
MTISGQSPAPGRSAGGMSPMNHQPANLGDILERVLDRGLVIVGDIRISLLDIELLTIKLRLLVASVDTARQLGIDWWEHDPWLSSASRTPIRGATARHEPITAGEREPLGVTYEPRQEYRPSDE